MGKWKLAAIVAVVAYVTYRLLSGCQRVDNLQDLLRGKNVVITGASSGIGEQAAIFYAKQGANVVVIARREALLKEVVKQCYKASPLPPSLAKFHYIVADFSDVENSEKVILEAIELLGGLDYLLLNHAYILSTPDLIGQWTGSAEQQETMRLSLDINFLSIVRMAGAALPALRATNGSMCVTSSFMVEVPAFSLPYASTKSALNAFFTGLRQELLQKNENVSITLIHLGLVHVSHTQEGLQSMSLARGRDLPHLPMTTADQAAADIALATVRREADIYYPYNQGLRWIRLLRLLLSNADEKMLAVEKALGTFSSFCRSVGLFSEAGAVGVPAAPVQSEEPQIAQPRCPFRV